MKIVQEINSDKQKLETQLSSPISRFLQQKNEFFCKLRMWRSKFADGLKHLEMQNEDTSCFWMCVGDAELTPDILIRKRRQNIEFDALFVSIDEQAPGYDLGKMFEPQVLVTIL